MAQPTSLIRLMEALKTLPGVGTVTAERLAYHLLRAPATEVESLAQALRDLLEQVTNCSECHTISDTNPCSICADELRDRRRILVVEKLRDVTAFEEAGWQGLYHVLLGHINPLEGVDAADLTIDELVERVREKDVEELILATNPDFEGDATALHLHRRLADLDVSVTRIARGVASGSTLEYCNSAMLSDALSGRAQMDSA